MHRYGRAWYYCRATRRLCSLQTGTEVNWQRGRYRPSAQGVRERNRRTVKRKERRMKLRAARGSGQM